MKTLGISAFYHDSAAAILEDSRILAAAQEERFTRKRFDAAFPERAIRYCLEHAGCTLNEVDRIVFYDKPFEKFDRILETFLAHAPRGFSNFRRALPVWMKEKLFLKKLLLDRLSEIGERSELGAKLWFSDHHLSHAASAFYPSPFEEAVVLVLDGVGEWATASVYLGRGHELKPVRELRFPHSLGLLYSAFTAYCGFKVNSGEYKLMGLAPFGKPRFREAIERELVRVAPDGSFALNMKFFDYCVGERMFNRRFEELLGGPARAPETQGMEDRFKDAAASIQAVAENILLKMTRALADEFKVPNLCLAGGVALNCVANGKIQQDGKFRRIWIQPAAGDAGGALGAALVNYYAETGSTRAGGVDGMSGAYLGPDYSDGFIETELMQAGAVYEKPSDLTSSVARLLAQGKAVGWFQGRMEFGPRALGARSILADPRPAQMQSQLNLKIKFRESFRPFAPVVTQEAAAEYFDLASESPYMLLTAQTKRQGLPAITHIDGSARVQTVNRDTNPMLHALLGEFQKASGCPVLVNTSFNVRGEPIVNTPAEAWRCFMGTDLDALAIGGYLLLKEDQPAQLKRRYESTIEKD
jgi:carbamoyltransferase